jgi:ADP-ribose pyrophosphatase YjhB (NUDIX family)
MGGHADGDKNLRRVAERELKEETGVENPRLAFPGIFGISVETVPEHVKRGKTVRPHPHLDVCYLFEADENEELRYAKAESTAVEWIAFDDIEKVVTEKNMIPIYLKCVRKIRELEL